MKSGKRISASWAGRGSSAAEHKVTLSEELRVQIADDIVRGVLPPGATLDESEVARRFNVSRTPVREALRQLAASGLVDVKPHRSTLVARPDTERLNAMFETMAELEAACAGFAAERMTSLEHRALEELHEQLRLLSYAGDPEKFNEVNELFHSAIYTGAHNTCLGELTLATRKRVQPFAGRSFEISDVLTNRRRNTAASSRLSRGDHAGAAAAMREHIDLVRNAYETYACLV